MGSLQQWKKDAKTIQESRCGSKVCGKMTDDKDKWAREIAAQCWCDKETENKTMDVSLAMAVAERIAFAYEEGRKAMEKEFRELLDLANGMFDRIIEGRSCAKAVKDFDDWKKSRGIE
jgi:CRISPR/Cas system CSM-associated protein Csm2 small subunit